MDDLKIIPSVDSGVHMSTSATHTHVMKVKNVRLCDISVSCFMWKNHTRGNNKQSRDVSALPFPAGLG